jgi:O-antigen ligase
LLGHFIDCLSSCRLGRFSCVFIYVDVAYSAQTYQRVLLFAALLGSLLALQSLVPQSSFQRLATAGTEGDLNGRLGTWREGVALFSEHPLLGVGSGAFTAAIETGKAPHSFVLKFLAKVGIIGFSLFATILAMAVYHASRQPEWSSILWLTVLMVWILGAATHNWEQRKQTWLFLSMIINSDGVFVRRKESRQSINLPVN